MKNEKDFLRRRVEEVFFVLKLFEKYSEKMPYDTEMQNMAYEYRRKYEALLKQYSSFSEGNGE